MKLSISFCVPVFNKVEYLAECLDSLIGQTLKNIEIIVVDDCSTDNSKELIEFYAAKDKRIKPFILPENKGRSYARNYGNAKANADIIAVQDADDMSSPDRAKTIVDYFKKNKCDVFYSSFIVSDMFGKPIEHIEAVPFDFERVKKTQVTYIGHSTMAMKKSVVMDIKYTDGDYSKLGLDDWKLQMDLYQAGYKFGFSDKPLVYYRQLSDSISQIRDATAVYRLKGEYFESIKEKKV